VGFCMAGLLACQEPLITAEEAAPFVTQWSTTVEAALLEQAEGAASAAALKGRLHTAGQADRGRANRDEPPFDALVDEVYAALEYRPMLVANGQLTARGKAIWEALGELEDHGLEPQKYQVEKIAETLSRLEAKRETYKGFDSLKATDEERAFALEFVTQRTHTDFELVEENYPTLTEALLDSSRGQRLKQALSDYEKMSAAKVGIETELEQLLAQAMVRYAREMRHFRIKEIFIHPREDDFYNEQEIRQPRPDRAKGNYTAGVIWRRAAHIAEEMTAANKTQILHDNIKQALRDVLNSDEPARVVAGLPPQNPQYAGLVAEHKRYRTIVANGGWKEITAPRTLNPGNRADVVRELKERLRIEGYYPESAPIDDHYDDALTQAIRTYQETHQMDVTGRPTPIFWRSLNVSAERRLGQIALNIDRWRKTNVRHENQVYAFVNITDFTVELWRDQKLDMRFPVVVGNNDLAVNPLTEEKEHANRTPTMAAYVDRVIFNPYWNVTPRIRAVRILPEVRMSEEKKYLAKMEGMRKQAQPAATARALPAGGAEGGEAVVEPAVAGEAVAAARPQQEPLTYGGGSPEEPLRFNMGVVRRLKGEGEDGALLSNEQLRKMFPYLDPDAGIVDVNVTNPEHIPVWYGENHYEVAFPGRTWEYVRMLPGGPNALGIVKIIFPNYHDVYFHDTPAKELFGRSVRAFSHGCIRLEKPLEFSKRLLEIDGQLATTNVENILRSGDYTPIFLRRQIPVYLEYYTVRVDDQGRANFLADVYNYDRLDG
jgi:L,D-transpeptidase YcbB